MVPSYKDLLKQREELDAKIAEAHLREKSDAIAKARQIIEDHGLTSEDVFPTNRRARATSGPTGKVEPKYRDPVSGSTWTGRGKPPKWIQDKDRAQFVI